MTFKNQLAAPDNLLPPNPTEIVGMSRRATGSVDLRDSRHTSSSMIGGDAKLWQRIFWILLVFMQLLYWYNGRNIGPHSDEMDMLYYGKANMAWYASQGDNESFLVLKTPDDKTIWSPLRYYGSGFEYIIQPITSLIVPTGGYEYGVRHVFTQIIAVLMLMFAGLLSNRFAGWRAAAATVLVLGLTPTVWGLALFDTKDVPLATGYIASIYFAVRLFEAFPRIPRGLLAGLGLAFLFACSVRIGAIILLPFFGALALLAFCQNRNHIPAKKVVRWCGLSLAAILVGFLGAILLWPFALLDPVTNILEALQASTHFPQRILFTFEGGDYSSVSLPPHYLLKSFSITLPIGIMVLLASGLVGLALTWKKNKGLPLVVLVLAGLFPILYADFTGMPVYNNWRHLLFAYPALVSCLVCGLAFLLQKIRRPAVQSAAWTIALTSLVPSTVWGMKNEPYQYVYYNELVGGVHGASYDYDLDYWQVGLKEGFDWVASQAWGQKDSIVVATNGTQFARYYFSHKYPGLKIRVNQSGFKSRYNNEWRYAVFSNLFLNRESVRYQWPPANIAHQIEVDDVTIAVVLSDKNRFDKKGIDALLDDKPKKADSLFGRYLAQIAYNPRLPVYLGKLDGYIAFARLAIGDTSTAFAYSERALKADYLDLVANTTVGIIFLGKKMYPEAYHFLKIAHSVDTSLTVVKNALQELQPLVDRGIITSPIYEK